PGLPEVRSWAGNVGFSFFESPPNPSNPYLAVLIERGDIAAPVVKLRGAGVGMVGHLTGLRERAVAFQVIRDAGGAHGGIADAGGDPRPPRMPLDHAVGVLLRHGVRRAGGAACGAEERPLSIVGDACSGDVLIQKSFELGNTGRFMFLTALL